MDANALTAEEKQRALEMIEGAIAETVAKGGSADDPFIGADKMYSLNDLKRAIELETPLGVKFAQNATSLCE